MAYFLYPNTEYAMACSVSFVTLGTKEDLSKITKKGVRRANYKTVCFLYPNIECAKAISMNLDIV